MRGLLARLVTLTTALVAVVMLAVATPWLWWDTRERAEGRVRLQADLVATAVSVDADPDALHRVLAAVPAGQRGHAAVHLPGRPAVGASRSAADDVEAARVGEVDPVRVEGGTVHLSAARTSEGEVAVVEVYLPAGTVLGEVLPVLAGLVLAAVLAVLGAVVVADRLSRPALRALRALAMTAVSIGEGRLNARVRVHGPRDLVVLGDSINAIGERVQDLLSKEREMAADVSHRLRTPLTALRLDAEFLPDTEGERIRDAIAALERDVDDIIRNVRPSAGSLAGERECDLAEAVRSRMGFWSMLGGDQGRQVEVDLPGGPARVALPSEECAAVLDALVGNVFRYTPAGSPLSVTVVRHAGWVTLNVEDAGPGFADPASALRRGASGGGSTGLGLDIVRHAVEATGGTVHLERGRLGGARVRARFAEVGVPHEADQPRAWRLRRSG
ncbi:HAMP domain-containing sensor histidine kinase [Nocardiopsis sp. N85]|uniref:sensor histidine kinase n=1 Tax=Nocardiopsis sp. N85 TaxID=3029400 RepID=UPI00237F1930|nr:HAMP domain-containing sensor histidine kinase [Nocardiopsis sp. N85]MDE3725330.1 HAMP domain-containing sensor histidine kinase [Nocardiopsis sp. N85]